AHVAQERAAFLVVLRGGDDGDVHPFDLLDLVVVDLGEDDLLADPERIVALAVERLGRDALEVANPGQRDAYQAIAELVHPGARPWQPPSPGPPGWSRALSFPCHPSWPSSRPPAWGRWGLRPWHASRAFRASCRPSRLCPFSLLPWGSPTGRSARRCAWRSGHACRCRGAWSRSGWASWIPDRGAPGWRGGCCHSSRRCRLPARRGCGRA